MCMCVISDLPPTEVEKVTSMSVNLMADSKFVDVYVTFSHMSEEDLLFFKMNSCHTIHHILLQLYCNSELSHSHNSVSSL